MHCSGKRPDMTTIAPLLSPIAYLSWRTVQAIVFALGLAIIAALVWRPQLGLTALWNVLIPVAPVLLVVAPGIWRDICPLATTALFPRHMGFSAHRKLSVTTQGWLALGGVLALLFIVPLRHTHLNTNGPLTAAVLVATGLLAFAMGLAFEWKSGWCSGLCPVHPVEKLYGSRPALSVPNAHCITCQKCSRVCPDSTAQMNPLCAPATRGHAIAGALLVGGFPGFVWGWFQVSDGVGSEWTHMMSAYRLPFVALATTLVLFVALRASVARQHRALLVRCFAAAAVSCYYWFRLPMLIGLGRDRGEGVLVDLSGSMPLWVAPALSLAATGFFIWWIVLRSAPRRAWTVRPPRA